MLRELLLNGVYCMPTYDPQHCIDVRLCRFIFFRTGEPQALTGKVLVSLLSPSGFTFAADLLAQYEGAGQVAQLYT